MPGVVRDEMKLRRNFKRACPRGFFHQFENGIDIFRGVQRLGIGVPRVSMLARVQRVFFL